MTEPDLKKYMPEGWQGKYPPCQIQVDAEGQLSHQGAPMVHPRILAEVFASVSLEDGHYVLRMDGKTCELEVEDTFFTVRRADLAGEALRVVLNDDSQEKIDPAGVWLGDNEMFYCRVKEGRFPARFSRPAYYQLAQCLEPKEDRYVLRVGGREYPLPVGAPEKA